VAGEDGEIRTAREPGLVAHFDIRDPDRLISTSACQAFAVGTEGHAENLLRIIRREADSFWRLLRIRRPVHSPAVDTRIVTTSREVLTARADGQGVDRPPDRRRPWRASVPISVARSCRSQTLMAPTGFNSGGK